MKITLSLFLCLIGLQVFSQDIPRDILIKRMDSVYAHAVTYQDHGEVEFRRKLFGVNRKIVRPFKTVFRRDELFRFSCHTKLHTHSLRGFQWDSTGIINGYTEGELWARKGNDFPAYIDSITAFSLRSAVAVPRMLMPGSIHGKHILRDYGPVSITGKENLDGQNCYVLTAGDSLKIWVDEDSLLIRQIAGPREGLVTRYHPVINRPLLAGDCIFDWEKENRAIFRAYAPRQYAGDVLLGLVFLVIGIRWLIKQLNRKNGIITKETVPPPKQRNQKIKLWALLLLIIAFPIYKHWFEPGMFIIMIGIALPIAILSLLFMHLRLPDWIYRNRLLFGKVARLLFLAGLLLSFSLAFNKADIPAFLCGGAILLLFFGLLAIRSYTVQKKNWNQLKNSTPCPEEKYDSISTAGGLIYSVDEKSAESNEGRIVLFHNRLVFAAKDGTLTTLLFHSIRNIRIHREFLVFPAGLELTDYSNKKCYLVVNQPYYWKAKIRR